MIPRCSSTKVVQTVPVGCIRSSRGQKIRFSIDNFKKSSLKLQGRELSYLVYITSSRDPLPKLFKLCPWGQNWPSLGGHNFTVNFIRKSSNNFFSWTTNGYLTKLNSNGPCVVPFQNCLNGSDLKYTCRSRGQQIGFQNATFKNLLVRNYNAQSFQIWYIASSRYPLPKLFKLCPWVVHGV